MRYKRSISPNRTTDGINNTWCFTFQLTKYHKCNLSHSQTRFLATATSQLQMKITFSKCFLFFPFRTCINFLLLYRVELTYNLIDNRLILIFGLLLDQSDHFITKMCWLLLFSFDRWPAISEANDRSRWKTKLQSSLRACYDFFSLTAILSWRFSSRQEKDMRIEKGIDFQSLIIALSGRKASGVYTARFKPQWDVSYNPYQK